MPLLSGVERIWEPESLGDTGGKSHTGNLIPLWLTLSQGEVWGRLSFSTAPRTSRFLAVSAGILHSHASHLPDQRRERICCLSTGSWPRFFSVAFVCASPLLRGLHPGSFFLTGACSGGHYGLPSVWGSDKYDLDLLQGADAS